MANLVILVGNIASGKSSLGKRFNKEAGYIIVSGDGLRYLFSGGDYVYSDKLQSFILETEFKLVNGLLKEGFDVIIDDSKNVSAGYYI